MEESVLVCYKERQSCVDNDFNREVRLSPADTCPSPPPQVEHLLQNIENFRSFVRDWLEFGEKIGNMATEGELEL